MATVTYIEDNGTEHRIDVEAGYTVMEAAVRNGIPGIVADCGGACACATCHCYVDPAWTDRVGDIGEQESEMLEFAEDRRENSRLSCQIKVTETLDGLVVRTPASQG